MTWIIIRATSWPLNRARAFVTGEGMSSARNPAKISAPRWPEVRPKPSWSDEGRAVGDALLSESVVGLGLITVSGDAAGTLAGVETVSGEPLAGFGAFDGSLGLFVESGVALIFCLPIILCCSVNVLTNVIQYSRKSAIEK
jgi:hypothetical protein